MKIFAVAGRPILHSRSPEIHSRWLRQSGIDAVYTRVRAESAKALVSLVRNIGIDGLNVTAPFKQSLLPLLHQVDPSAAAVGGVNTVLNRKGRLKGFNTDPSGVVGPFARRGIDLAGKNCMVLGAGGAGRSAAWALVREKALVTVADGKHAKALRCASDFGCRAVRMAAVDDIVKRSEILINTIPADEALVRPSSLLGGVVILDSVYRLPWLSSIARKRGVAYIPGEEWLWDQAAESFQIFTGARRRNPARAAASVAGFSAGKTANVSLIGFMGCGKTTVGQTLARRLGFGFVDTDAEIENAEGRSVAEIFDRSGEAYFRKKERAAIRKLASRRGVALACGGGAVLDPRNRAVLRRHSLVIWLFAPVASTLERLAGDTRPLLRGPDRARTAERIFKARKCYYALASDLIVDASGPADEVARIIHEEIDHAVDR